MAGQVRFCRDCLAVAGGDWTLDQELLARGSDCLRKPSAPRKPAHRSIRCSHRRRRNMFGPRRGRRRPPPSIRPTTGTPPAIDESHWITAANPRYPQPWGTLSLSGIFTIALPHNNAITSTAARSARAITERAALQRGQILFSAKSISASSSALTLNGPVGFGPHSTRGPTTLSSITVSGNVSFSSTTMVAPNFLLPPPKAESAARGISIRCIRAGNVDDSGRPGECCGHSDLGFDYHHDCTRFVRGAKNPARTTAAFSHAAGTVFELRI